VKRRFEYVIRERRLVFIDDYAHHPEELRALIRGARSLFPQRRCTIVFQPHLFSRTRDLAHAFAEVLDEADEVILLPVYPAREEPLPGVSSELIVAGLTRGQGVVKEKNEWLNWIKEHYAKHIHEEFGGLLITAGAGDIDALVEPARQLLVNDQSS
jgi:UDP-N-acetylmuramate--alanine ligase